MLRRIKIGGILLAALAAIIAFDLLVGFPAAGLAVALFFTIAAQFEAVTLLRERPRRVLVVIQTAAVAIFLALVTASLAADDVRGLGVLPAVLLAGSSLGVLAVLVQATIRLQRHGEEQPGEHARDVAAGVFSLAYVVVPMALLGILALTRGGEGTLFAGLLVFISKCGDIGGYLGGSLYGRHRVMPKVSPNKTWEGSATGLALTVSAALLVRALAPDLLGLGVAATVVFAVVVNVATQLGDFAESMIKRSCGKKDAADLIPTFGGAMDILDSLVFAVPAAAIFLFAVA